MFTAINKNTKNDVIDKVLVYLLLTLNKFHTSFLVLLSLTLRTYMFAWEFCRIMTCIIWANHCVKSGQIRSYFWSVFSCVRSEYGIYPVFSPDTGRYGPETTPHLDTFHAVYYIVLLFQHINMTQAAHTFSNKFQLNTACLITSDLLHINLKTVSYLETFSQLLVLRTLKCLHLIVSYHFLPWGLFEF